MTTKQCGTKKLRKKTQESTASKDPGTRQLKRLHSKSSSMKAANTCAGRQRQTSRIELICGFHGICCGCQQTNRIDAFVAWNGVPTQGCRSQERLRDYNLFPPWDWNRRVSFMACVATHGCNSVTVKTRVGCGVWGVGCGVWGVGCGVWSGGCGVWSVECGVWGLTPPGASPDTDQKFRTYFNFIFV